MQTRSTTRSQSRIQRRFRNRGRPSFPSRSCRTRRRSTSTRVTRGITPWRTSSAARAPNGEDVEDMQPMPMRMKLAVVLTGAGLLCGAASAAAHHAFAAEFDAKKPLRLQGTVARMEWINPHTWIHLDVKKADGKVERWMIEGGPPNALYRRGFTKDSLPVGAQIVVEGFRAKDGSLRGNGRDITFADGRKLFLGSSGTGAPVEKPNTPAQ